VGNEKREADNRSEDDHNKMLEPVRRFPGVEGGSREVQRESSADREEDETNERSR